MATPVVRSNVCYGDTLQFSITIEVAEKCTHSTVTEPHMKTSKKTGYVFGEGAVDPRIHAEILKDAPTASSGATYGGRAPSEVDGLFIIQDAHDVRLILSHLPAYEL